MRVQRLGLRLCWSVEGLALLVEGSGASHGLEVCVGLFRVRAPGPGVNGFYSILLSISERIG